MPIAMQITWQMFHIFKASLKAREGCGHGLVDTTEFHQKLCGSNWIVGAWCMCMVAGKANMANHRANTNNTNLAQG